jgi:hypothetical protein
MPRMLGNLSIRSKLLALLAVPVAGPVPAALTGRAAAQPARRPAYPVTPVTS